MVLPVLLSLVLAVSPAAAAPAPPASMASLGDSITRGFNACGFYVDCTSRSFSTGGDPAVNSHLQRIRAVNRTATAHNDARSGAQSQDLPGQADTAVSQDVQYATILIGANDACASSEAAMTPVATFRGHIDTALGKLKAGLPDARLLVISIPDIKRLWEVGRGSALARGAWSLLNICQSMLASPTSTAAADADRRDRVRQRVVEYNAQLAEACTAYGPNCRFDDNAVFNFRFTLAEVSGWDYFHPDVDGQRALAQVSYAAGYGW